MHVQRVSMKTRHAGGATRASLRTVPVLSPLMGSRVESEGPGSHGADRVSVRPWTELLGLDWMSSLARGDLGGVRIA